MQRIKNIIFDLGGVLLECDPDKIVSAVFDDHAVRERVKQVVFMGENWIEFDKGSLTESEAVDIFSRESGRSRSEITTLMSVYRRMIVPIEESMALLGKLHRSGVRLYCLSNVNTDVFSDLRARYDFWEKFRGIVISGETGTAKPDPRIYKNLLNTHSLVPELSVYIDDKEQNIRPALDLGMRAILHTSASDTANRLRAFRPGS